MRLSTGAEVAAGPRESYDDASVDFALENDVVYQHIDPAIGASTHSHGTDIRGNIKIFYDVIIDHGNLVGDGKINAAHLNSGSAALGDIATAQGDGTVLYAPPGDAPSVDGFSFVRATQAEYDALTPDADTIYLITA